MARRAYPSDGVGSRFFCSRARANARRRRAAEGVRLGRHQLAGEALEQRPDKVRAALIKLLAQPVEGIHRGVDHRRLLLHGVLADSMRMTTVVTCIGAPT